MLTKKQCEERFKLIDQDSLVYNVICCLDNEYYYVQTEMTLKLKEDSDIFIDKFYGEMEKSYLINGQQSTLQMKDGSIILNNLKKDQEYKIIFYSYSQYSNNGYGLHKFEQDGKIFVYSQLDNQHASEFFPNFDQPDIKGRLQLQVYIDQDLKIISNQPEIQKDSQKDFYYKDKIGNKKLVSFSETPQLSSYLYALCFGHYEESVLNIQVEGQNISSKIYYRPLFKEQALKYLDKIQQSTSFYIQNYNKLFDFKYPYEKCDFIFVTEFNAGAMENNGCITLNESYLDQQNEEDVYELLITIGHEIAHHWFGNLVTFKWFDELWLNESFADYISYKVMIDNQFTDISQKLAFQLYQRRKLWGKYEDKLINTHPINCDIKDTKESELIYDGISYSKGMQVLEQLHFIVGDSFFKGLQDYFKKFQYKNTKMNDLVGCIQKYCQIDLQKWVDNWLNTKGINLMHQSRTEKGIKIVQDSCLKQFQQIREHKTMVSFYDQNMKLIEIKEIMIDKEVQEFNVDIQFSCFFINHNHKMFAEVVIDQQSIDCFTKQLYKIEDYLNKNLIINSLLFQNLYKFTAENYLELVKNNVEHEQNRFLVKQIIQKLYQFINKLPQKFQNQIKKEAFDYFKQLFQKDFFKSEIIEQMVHISFNKEQLNFLIENIELMDQITIIKLQKKVLFSKEFETTPDFLKNIKNQIFLQKYQEFQKFVYSSQDMKQEIYSQLKDKLFQNSFKLYLEQLKGCLIYQYNDFIFKDQLQDIYYNYNFNLFETIFDIIVPDENVDEIQNLIDSGKIQNEQLINLLKAKVQEIQEQKQRETVYMQHSQYLKQKPNAINIELAKKRSDCIMNQKTVYDIFIFLNQGQNYQGIININFFMRYQDEVIMDFQGNVINIQINGEFINDYKYNGFNIFMDKKYFKEDENNIVIYFKNQYCFDGSGLMSFIDKNKKQYLFSDGEPAKLNNFFPMFDQPNLKAKYQLRVLSPKNWTILNNTGIQKEGFEQYSYKNSYVQTVVNNYIKQFKDKKFTEFKQTKILSTYLFCMCAGDYFEIEIQNSLNMNMNLYCKEEILDVIKQNSNYIIECTEKSIKYYEQKFGVKYQFDQYIQVFCPEFNMGAMENAGIITINDSIFNNPNPNSRIQLFQGICLSHEASHQWFGNYVTMDWWDDVWLNESFAEFISTLCMSETTIESQKIDNPWLQFNERLSRAYDQDKSKLTHPIKNHVQDTLQAQSIFDSITYSKGSQVLKQIYYLMGPDNFYKSINSYFNKFAFSNAKFSDLINCLKENFDKLNFDDFVQQHVMTPGYNMIDIQSIDNNKIVFKYTYCNPDFKDLKIQKVKFALFTEQGIEFIDYITTNQPEQVIEIDNAVKFYAVLPNYEE